MTEDIIKAGLALLQNAKISEPRDDALIEAREVHGLIYIYEDGEPWAVMSKAMYEALLNE